MREFRKSGRIVRLYRQLGAKFSDVTALIATIVVIASCVCLPPHAIAATDKWDEYLIACDQDYNIVLFRKEAGIAYQHGDYRTALVDDLAGTKQIEMCVAVAAAESHAMLAEYTYKLADTLVNVADDLSHVKSQGYEAGIADALERASQAIETASTTETPARAVMNQYGDSTEWPVPPKLHSAANNQMALIRSMQKGRVALRRLSYSDELYRRPDQLNEAAANEAANDNQNCKSFPFDIARIVNRAAPAPQGDKIGSVFVLVDVDVTGNVVATRIGPGSSPDPDLQAAAISAARQSTYRAGLQNCQPIAGTVNDMVTFYPKTH